jgi:hypothetical protein
MVGELWKAWANRECKKNSKIKEGVEKREGRGIMEGRRSIEGMGNRESRIYMEVRRNMEGMRE